MKKVLFIGVTHIDFIRDSHLRKKFEGLSREIKPYVLARGRWTFGKKIFGAEFYLLPKTVFFWPMALKLAFWLCLTKKIDVIVAQSPLMEGLAGAILKKIFKKELIVELHGDWQEGPFLSKKRKLEFIERKLTPFLARISLRNADKIRAVALYLIEEARKIAPQKPCFIFPTFTDLDDFFNEKDAKLGNSVLFVGRNEKVKGAEYLVEAFSAIKKDFPDFELALIGPGLPLGRLPLAEVRNKMKDCYCLVVPSLSEGLPRVIMEAQALGKSVIASRVGGIPELIKDGETGLLFEAGNVKELAEKLIILLSHKQLAIDMGSRARRAAEERFSNNRYLENYLKMIYS